MARAGAVGGERYVEAGMTRRRLFGMLAAAPMPAAFGILKNDYVRPIFQAPVTVESVSNEGTRGSVVKLAGYRNRDPLYVGDILHVTGVRIFSKTRGKAIPYPLAQVVTRIIKGKDGVSIELYPPYVTSGPHRNCTNTPRRGAHVGGYFLGGGTA